MCPYRVLVHWRWILPIRRFLKPRQYPLLFPLSRHRQNIQTDLFFGRKIVATCPQRGLRLGGGPPSLFGVLKFHLGVLGSHIGASRTKVETIRNLYGQEKPFRYLCRVGGIAISGCSTTPVYRR